VYIATGIDMLIDQVIVIACCGKETYAAFCASRALQKRVASSASEA